MTRQKSEYDKAIRKIIRAEEKKLWEAEQKNASEGVETSNVAVD